MQLTKEGKKVLKYEAKKKEELVAELIGGKKDVKDYIKGGICYDVAAFVKYLFGRESTDYKGTAIKEDVLISKEFNGNHCINNLISSTVNWQYGVDIIPGSIITFFWLREKRITHAAVAIGGTKVRAVNGFSLGHTWKEEVVLKDAMQNETNNDVCSNDGKDYYVQIQEP